jgi:hypothetical protein
MPNVKAKARIERMFADGRQIDRALQSAVRGAIRDHQARNAPVAVWRNGRATLVPAQQLTGAKMTGSKISASKISATKTTGSKKVTVSPKRKAAKKRRAR